MSGPENRGGAGTDVCMKCSGAKEPTRHKSNLCRTCDGAGRPARARVTLTLPKDVYARCEAEAARQGVSAGTMLARLIVARDERQQSKRNT